MSGPAKFSFMKSRLAPIRKESAIAGPYTKSEWKAYCIRGGLGRSKDTRRVGAARTACDVARR